MNSETAQKAAKWWADQLRNGAKLDNGDDSGQGAMAAMLGMMCQDNARSNMTPESIDDFQNILAKTLKDKKRVIFGVDYHPDALLSDAAELAGLALGQGSLPWKTTMWVEDDMVTVSCGYGAPTEEIA